MVTIKMLGDIYVLFYVTVCYQETQIDYYRFLILWVIIYIYPVLRWKKWK